MSRSQLHLSIILLVVIIFCVPVRADISWREPDMKTVAYNDYRLPVRVIGIIHQPPNPQSSIQDDVKIAEESLIIFIEVKRNWHPNWKAVIVLVFRDTQSGQILSDYLVKRQGRMLQPEDFRNLTDLWRKVPLCYIYTYNKSKPKLLYPYTDPQHWWQVKPLYDAATDLKAQRRSGQPVIFSSETQHEPSYMTNQRLNQQVRAAQKGVNTEGLDLPPDVMQPSPSRSHPKH